jgi:hypothetical protein
MSLETKLSYLLSSVCGGIGYSRGVLIYLDRELMRAHTLETCGFSPKGRKIELAGPSKEGYGLIEPGNPAFTALELDELPFHTCLNTAYMKAEFSRSGGGLRRSYFIGQLARKLVRIRRKRYEELRAVGVIPSSLTFADFTKIQSDLPEERIYDSCVYRKTAGDFCNTLTLGVKLDTKLIAIAQFDSPTNGNSKEPLSLVKQKEAQDQLEEYASAILLQGVLQHIRYGRSDLAERDLSSMISSGTFFVPCPEITKFPVDFSSAGINEIIERSVPDPKTAKPICVKDLGHFLGQGLGEPAKVDYEVRRRSALIGERVFRSRLHTSRFVFSDFYPHVSVADILNNSNISVPAKRAILGMIKGSIERVRGIDFSDLPCLAPSDHFQKLFSALTTLLPHFSKPRLFSLCEEATNGFELTHRRQDKTLYNLVVPTSGLVDAYGLPPALVSPLETVPTSRRFEDVRALCEYIGPLINGDEASLLTVLEKNMTWSDYDSMNRLTFGEDDFIESASSPPFRFSLDQRIGLMAGLSPRKIFYRNVRSVVWSQILGASPKNDSQRRSEYLRNRFYYLELAIESGKSIGNGELGYILQAEFI